MRRYVVGFLFDNESTRVVLIRKNRPEWQTGKANGVGGKIEQGEMPIEAMVREFEEEAGVKTSADDWNVFAFMHGVDFDDFEITFFRAFNTKYLNEAHTTTDEAIGRWWVDAELPKHVPNIKWLIPLAMEKQAYFVDITWWRAS